MSFDKRRHIGGELSPVDRKRTARRDLMTQRRSIHMRSKRIKLCFDEPCGAVGLLALQRIGADELA